MASFACHYACHSSCYTILLLTHYRALVTTCYYRSKSRVGTGNRMLLISDWLRIKQSSTPSLWLACKNHTTYTLVRMNRQLPITATSSKIHSNSKKLEHYNTVSIQLLPVDSYTQCKTTWYKYTWFGRSIFPRSWTGKNNFYGFPNQIYLQAESNSSLSPISSLIDQIMQVYIPK